MEGKEALMLVDTGASRSCLSEAFYNQHQRQLGGLHSTSPIQGADGTELALAGETGRLRLQWRGRTLRIPLIVVRGLAGVDGILGMDVLKPLQVKILAHANLAEPGGSRSPEKKILCLADNLDLPPRSWQQIHLHHDLPSSTTIFSPTTKLPPGLRAAPTVSKGESVVVTIANYTAEPARLQKGWEVGSIEPGEIAEPPANPSGPKLLPEVPGGLTASQTCDMRNLLMDYQDIFAQGEDDRGLTSLVEHRIYTKGPPIRQPFRRQPPARREEERSQVESMARRGVIRPSSSPWSSPVVLAKKKDGSLRFCVDYRRLNAATVKDAQPLPRIDDTLEALHGSRWFSTLDLQSGYWQVPLCEKDKEKTAFCTG